MLDSWQEIISFIVSVIGVLTTIYNIGFKKKRGRVQAYYEKILRPFAVAYQKNNDINAIKFLKNIAKRDNDNIPKYIFFLLDSQEKDKLKKVLIYDYFDIYSNDDNAMRLIMRGIARLLVYLLFGASLIAVFYGSYLFTCGILSFLMDLLHGFEGTINGIASWKWDLLYILGGVFSIGLSSVYMSLVRKINDDWYTFKKKKINKLIINKVKAYDKYREKNIV